MTIARRDLAGDLALLFAWPLRAAHATPETSPLDVRAIPIQVTADATLDSSRTRMLAGRLVVRNCSADA